MLTRLYIKNFAIIQELEISFKDGLVIITGETGAGKSILMGALGLALGERADSTMIKDREAKTIVEADFKVKQQKELLVFFHRHDFEWDDHIMVRRELLSSGKSRAFINDSPASLSQVQELTSLLVDLHQQFDTLELSNRQFQQTILDARAGCLDDLSNYQQVYYRFKEVEGKIFSLQESLRKSEQERAFQQYLLSELEELNWRLDEEKAITEELNLLTNAEQIRLCVGAAGYALTEGENPLVSEIKSIISKLQPLVPYHASLAELVTRLSSSHLELKDIGSELSNLADQVNTDEKRLDELNSRISTAQRLMKKHGVSSANDLIEIQLSLHQTISSYDDNQSSLVLLQKELTTLEQEAMIIAKKIHQKRVKQIPLLEQSATELLSRVGMPNAVFKIAIKEINLSSTGIDLIEFLFDANKSGKFEPLHKVASGGELSRLMLVLKSLVAKSLDMPTLIFDEIDSGISGEAAKQVGILLEELSASHQLISITHQPQIAAKADQHLFVYKSEVHHTITTGIRELSFEERVNTIAQMLSGENPSQHALANAKEMIKS